MADSSLVRWPLRISQHESGVRWPGLVQSGWADSQTQQSGPRGGDPAAHENALDSVEVEGVKGCRGGRYDHASLGVQTVSSPAGKPQATKLTWAKVREIRRSY